MKSNGQVDADLLLSQEDAFTQTALPMTMSLAKALKSVIAGRLGRHTEKWPFEDRVLVWLEPSLRDDIERFHSSSGPNMVGIFKSWQVERLDQDFFRNLAERAEEIQPGVITLRRMDLAEEIEGTD